MRYGVLGIRDFLGKEYDNLEYVSGALSEFYASMDLFVTGGGKGIEAVAERWARSRAFPMSIKIVKPQIIRNSTHDAFTRRNEEIVAAIDVLVMFWDGVTSTYLSGAIGQAARAGKRVIVIPVVE